MNPILYYSIFIALAISVKAVPNVEELFKQTDTQAKTLVKVNSGPIQNLMEVLKKSSDSYLELENKYLERGSNMIREIVKTLLNYFKSDASSSLSDDKKQKIEETVSALKYQFEKCVTSAVNRAIKLTNTELKTVKSISDNIKATRSQPNECLAKDDARICFRILQKNFNYLQSNLVDQISDISVRVQKASEELAKKLETCISQIMKAVLKNTPEVIDAVLAERKSRDAK